MQGAGGEESEVQAGYAFHVLKTAHEEAKIFSEKQKDLGMACHTPPLKKSKETPLPILGPIPSLNSTFF